MREREKGERSNMGKKKEKSIKKQLDDARARAYEAKMKYLLESLEYKMQRHKVKKRTSKIFPVQ